VLVDDFENLSPWSVHPAEGVRAAVASDSGAHGKALRLVVRFDRGTGYAVVRRAVSLDLPADYAFRFQLRGEIPVNHLELKLADSTGQNVWWHVRRDLQFPRTWQTMTTRARQVRFAWGPAGGGVPRHVSFIEFAVTAGEGGSGSVWIDDLTLETLAPDSTAPRPTATASTSRHDHLPEMALDGNPESWWASAPADSALWFEIDLGRSREFGGLVIDWQSGAPPPDYAIELSQDRASWAVRHRVERSNGGRDALYLPESEARYIRIRAAGDLRGRVLAIREVGLRPLEWSASPEAFFTGENSSARSTSSTTLFSERASASKTKVSNLTPWTFWGRPWLQTDISLRARCQGSLSSPEVRSPTNSADSACTAMLPAR